jgi:purine-binding chemotaxis protein CheW
MNPSPQFCTFYLDDLCFGVPVTEVQEVLQCQEMTSVPMAPREVCGLINLRGQIVTVIDLRRCLSLTDRIQPSGINVIVRTGEDVVSLRVDEMGNVENVDDSQFEPPPDTLSGDHRELISGTYKMPDRLLLVLDIPNVIDQISGRTKQTW